MGTIKDRNVMGLTEGEDIKKKWQEYTELYRRDRNDPDKHCDHSSRTRHLGAQS